MSTDAFRSAGETIIPAAPCSRQHHIQFVHFCKRISLMAGVRPYVSTFARLAIVGSALVFGWCCDTASAQPAFPSTQPGPSYAPAPPPGPSASAPSAAPAIQPYAPPPAEEIPLPSVAPEAQEMVVDVRVTGNVSIPLHKIAPNIATRAGRPFNPELIEQDCAKLTKTRQFVSVNPTYQRVPEGVVVVFQVLERPTLRYVKYVGASIRRTTLDKKSELKVGDSIDPYVVDEGRRKLEDYYLSKGFSKVRVTTIEGNKPGDRGAVFLINEGPKQKVYDIEFEGNTIADDARLKTQIQSKTPILYLFKGEVDQKKIDEDVDRLTDYYRSLGFWSAKIGRELEYGEDGKWATLRFVINEGPRYNVRNVSIIGNKKFQTSELAAQLKLQSGSVYNRASMMRDVSDLQDRYGGIGYVFSNVQPDIRFYETPGELDLVYQIEEGDRYRVGRIDVRIEGDDPHTRINTVLNRIDLRPGDIVDVRRIRDSERRLKASGLFKNDPAQGIAPKITFQAPEDDTSLARGPGGGTVRGQSPDDARPPVVYSTPTHDGSGDRVLTVSFEGESATGAQPLLQRGPLPFVPVDPRPLPNGPTPAAQGTDVNLTETDDVSFFVDPFRTPVVDPTLGYDDVELFRGMSLNEWMESQRYVGPSWGTENAGASLSGRRDEGVLLRDMRSEPGSRGLHLKDRSFEQSLARIRMGVAFQPYAYPTLDEPLLDWTPDDQPRSVAVYETSARDVAASATSQPLAPETLALQRQVFDAERTVVRFQSPDANGYAPQPAGPYNNSYNAAPPTSYGSPQANYGQSSYGQASGYGQVPMGAVKPQTAPANYAGATSPSASPFDRPTTNVNPASYGGAQQGNNGFVAQAQYTQPGAPVAQPYSSPAGVYQPPAATGVAPYGSQPGSPPLVNTQGGAPAPPVLGYGSGNDMFGAAPTAPFVNEPLTRDLILTPTVQEAQTGRFMLGVGVNSNAGLLGSIVLDEQNADITRLPTSWRDFVEGRAFRGAGQQVRIEAVPGTQVSRYSFIFRQPYLFDTRVSFSGSAYYFQRYYTAWMEERLGGRISLGYQFPFVPDLSVSSALRMEQVTLSDPQIPTPPQLASALGDTNLFVGEFAITHDTRDSTFIATQGHRVSLGFDIGFGTYTFPRGTIDARQHFLLNERPDGSGRQVLTLQTQLGFTGSETPIFENYFAGGFSSMRGFNFRGVGPVVQNVNVGGQFQWLNTVEYMFSMTADDMVRGVVFCDFGTVEEKIALHADNFRVAPGFGLRITVPAMGPAPIALDFAVPVAHADGDNIQNFAFYVGFGR
jgi:outer membrane protein insertion porin family